MADKKITWTPEMRDRFRVAYKAAVKAGVETFTFDGNEFVVGYAKYLLEYLDSRLA